MKSVTKYDVKENHTDLDSLEVYHMLASKWAQKIEQSRRPKNKKFKNKD